MATTLSSDAVASALAELRARFPINDYIPEDAAPHRTVGRIVSTYLKPGGKVYDFGAGACDKTAVAQLLGMQCTAYDDLMDNWYRRDRYADRIIEFAQSLGIEFAREFHPPSEGSLDMVMLNDVLEHLHDSPRNILNALVRSLREHALLFVSVPNLANLRKRLALLRGRTNLPRFDLYYWYEGPWRGPVREYVMDDLIRLTTNLGLEIVELTTADHMLGNLPPSVRRVYRSVIRLAPKLRDTWVLVASKPSGWSVREPSEEHFAEIYAEKNKAVLHR